MGSTTDRETCHRILAHLFGQDTSEIGTDLAASHSLVLYHSSELDGNRTISKSKVGWFVSLWLWGPLSNFAYSHWSFNLISSLVKYLSNLNLD